MYSYEIASYLNDKFVFSVSVPNPITLKILSSYHLTTEGITPMVI
jgi:hypothetical protein